MLNDGHGDGNQTSLSANIGHYSLSLTVLIRITLGQPKNGQNGSIKLSN